MSEENVRGRFVWYDLLTPDPEAAKAFYTAVVGWGTQTWEAPGTTYTMWTAGGKPIGGIMKTPDDAGAGGARPHWLAYVEVPDADATTARARELGGTVRVPPTDIETVGRFSVIADPDGAVIAPFTPKNVMPESQGPAPLGEFSWHELATRDQEAAFGFYADLFGWEKVSAFDMGPMGVYQLYGRRGQPLGGIYNLAADAPGGPAWLHYARVVDVNAAVETVRQHGGQVVHGPADVPGGDWIAIIVDPQGAPFAVHEMKAAQA